MSEDQVPSGNLFKCDGFCATADEPSSSGSSGRGSSGQCKLHDPSDHGNAPCICHQKSPNPVCSQIKLRVKIMNFTMVSPPTSCHGNLQLIISFATQSRFSPKLRKNYKIHCMAIEAGSFSTIDTNYRFELCTIFIPNYIWRTVWERWRR